MGRTSAQVRAELAAALPLDLVGPSPGHEHENEVVSQPPSRWYLTGFLVPFEAPEEQRCDPTGNEEIAAGGEGGGDDDDEAPELASARKVHFPSSVGLSVLIPPAVRELEVTVSWGDYRPVLVPREGTKEQEEVWRREPRSETIIIDPRRTRDMRVVPHSAGLKLAIATRALGARSAGLAPKGTRVVSVFLVNHRTPSSDQHKEESFVFQAGLRIEVEGGFHPRPNLRGLDGQDWDEQVSDLQFRGECEYAVGHGVATRAILQQDGSCRCVETTWIPGAQVEKVVPGEIQGVELEMETLAAAPVEELEAKLRLVVEAYEGWIHEQGQQTIEPAGRREVAEELFKRARVVKKRIAAGIEVLTRDPQALEAFRVANRCMARQARRRSKDLDGKGPAPRWYLFQLAFLLLNLRSMSDPTHPDRETVDLLFFPTGGGKTEAYLGLAAFALVLRRLRNPGLASAGVAVLMRYTLRLLTLDQLGRAATLICALELERQQNPGALGPWPFEIGLWVGRAATPNRIGKKGDSDANSARSRTIAYKNDSKKPSPIPLENCPWCDTKFGPLSFTLVAGGKPNNDHPTDLRIQCLNRGCDFSANKGQQLPILSVDEAIYRRLPCFLIATVDKFAALPWVGQTGLLLGRASRHDSEGFYGASDPSRGRPLERPLPPPELIIQDELHLISGPLGTMVGLYETVLDELSAGPEGGDGAERVRPKIVASTATVRRAQRQIHALFARHEVEVFPPPGPDLRDSFFARTVAAADADDPAPGTRHARMYLGVAAQGRSLKVVLLRTYLALMAAAQRIWDEEGKDKNPKNPADPYMTALGYFNSLRELGGSRRIIEDEVRARLQDYGRRRRQGEAKGAFHERKIAYEVVELTSRESTAKVADTKRRLGLSFHQAERVDVALATNMISVGLDITRLGLMIVLGQPKTAAEYIQATSRVGRDDRRPGLVVTLMNIHRPRDRSHYERFEAFHRSFYRSVEATSVTPFAPRAIDRGLAGVVVALARHGHPGMTGASRAVSIDTLRPQLGFVARALGRRLAAHDPQQEASLVEEGRARLEGRVNDLLDAWAKLAHEQAEVGAGLQYQREEGGAPPLLRDPLDPELETLPRAARKFRAHRSLRDVEPSVNLWVKQANGDEGDFEEVES
jgi:hypothetical protein